MKSRGADALVVSDPTYSFRLFVVLTLSELKGSLFARLVRGTNLIASMYAHPAFSIYPTKYFIYKYHNK
jgi:hypothetical protein